MLAGERNHLMEPCGDALLSVTRASRAPATADPRVRAYQCQRGSRALACTTRAREGHRRGTAPVHHRALHGLAGVHAATPLRVCPCAALPTVVLRLHPTSPGEERLVPTADHDPDALDVLDTSFRLLVAGPSPLAIDGAALGHGLPARLIPLDQLRATPTTGWCSASKPTAPSRRRPGHRHGRRGRGDRRDLPRRRHPRRGPAGRGHRRCARPATSASARVRAPDEPPDDDSGAWDWDQP